MIDISDVSMVFENKPYHGKVKYISEKGADIEESAPREKALDSVSFQIPESCIYGFTGFNGAGKSTLMRIICGVYKPTSGTVKVDGLISFNNPAAKEKLFFVNDETIEYSDFTLDRLMKYYSGYYPQFDRELLFKLGKQLELPFNRKLSTFSKGMKRQSIVLIGLSCHTKYLILDEAFDGLDPAMRKMIKEIIVDEVRTNGTTLIVSSHNVLEIGDMCDKVMRLSKGKLVFSDRASAVESSVKKYQMISGDRIITPENIKDAGINFDDYSRDGHVIKIIVSDNDNTEDKIRMLEPLFYEELPLNLEEVFIYEKA